MQIEKIATASASTVQMSGVDKIFRTTGMVFYGVLIVLGAIFLLWLIIKLLRFLRSHRIVAKS